MAENIEVILLQSVSIYQQGKKLFKRSIGI